MIAAEKESYFFDSSRWGDASNVANEDRNDEDGRKMAALYPELEGWDPLVIEWAWAWFSQTIYLVSYMSVDAREIAFLDYLTAEQEAPRLREGTSFEEIQSFRHFWMTTTKQTHDKT